MKIEEVKQNFIEWCKGFLNTHVDYKIDMPFDLDFVAEGIWEYIRNDYENFLSLEVEEPEKEED